VAKNDRRVRSRWATGWKARLPDAIANRIITEAITPRFKLGDYDGGVEAGVDRIVSVVNGEPLPEPDKKWERRGGGLGNALPLISEPASPTARRASRSSWRPRSRRTTPPSCATPPCI